jgi:hypothetical protein
MIDPPTPVKVTPSIAERQTMLRDNAKRLGLGVRISGSYYTFYRDNDEAIRVSISGLYFAEALLKGCKFMCQTVPNRSRPGKWKDVE